jgi:hypothetical protein
VFVVRDHGNDSARARAATRRWTAGTASSAATAAASARGLRSWAATGAAPHELGHSRSARRHHGRAAGQRLERREPEGLCGSGGKDDVRCPEQVGDGRAVGDVPDQLYRQSTSPAPQRGGERAGPGNHEPGGEAAATHHAQGFDGQVGSLLSRQPAAEHEQGDAT